VAWEHGLRAPFSIYPLFEGAARARLGTSFEGAQARSGAIWADFSSIAANNPGAWRTATMSAADILAPGPLNRLVAQPYRKLMCAEMEVDQAAAVVLTTVAEARHLGIPRSASSTPSAVPAPAIPRTSSSAARTRDRRRWKRASTTP